VDYVNLLRIQRREEIAMVRGRQNKDGEWEITLSHEEENELTRQCILDGASSRIRPILITTLTTLLGDIPMAMAKGEGAEIYAPMGQVIVGGLLSSTLITLLIIPVLYEIMEKKKSKQIKRKKGI
jgi:HAE1 family hydrophobic/amphiphilic exporter-1